MTPSSAATTSSTKSMPVAPASMLCTNFSCPGTSTKPSTDAVRRRQIGKAEIDRDAARFLLLQAIGIDAGQRAHQRGLAVIDMAGGADDHGDSLRAAQLSARLATKASSSSRQRRSSTRARSSMRPITGTGRRRNAAARTASARAALCRSERATRAPRSATDFDGRAPEPIWLAQAITSTVNGAAERRRHDRRQPARQCLDRVLRAAPRGARSAGAAPDGRDRDTVSASLRCAASLILSTRRARFIGLRLRRAIRSRRPTMKPACGPPKSLSPENVTRSAPSCIASATVGSWARPKRREVDQRAGAEIVDERHAALARERRKVAREHLGGEARDAIVRGVDLEHETRLRSDRRQHSPSDGCGWWFRPRPAWRPRGS